MISEKRLLYSVSDFVAAAASGYDGDAPLFAFAESCTGGLLASTAVSVSGASRYFHGGIVAYSDEAKAKLLGVSRETLAIHGAVSAECAAEMARGCRERFGAIVGVSTTGFAGPDGGTDDAPVGTVWIAASTENETRLVRAHHPGLPRNVFRVRAARRALELLLYMLSKKTSGAPRPRTPRQA